MRYEYNTIIHKLLQSAEILEQISAENHDPILFDVAVVCLDAADAIRRLMPALATEKAAIFMGKWLAENAPDVWEKLRYEKVPIKD